MFVPGDSKVQQTLGQDDRVVKRVRAFALQTRFGFLFLQFICNALVVDFESDFEINTTAGKGLANLTYLAQRPRLSPALKGLTRYDARFFLDIAEHGYTSEKSLAFFPFLPLCLRLASELLKVVLGPQWQTETLLVVAGVIMNAVCVVLAAEYLYKLSKHVLGDSLLAYKAALMFCVSPISVFTSAIYTEALFSCLLFTALYLLHEKGLGYKTAGLFFLASATRSNGLLSGGFVLYHSLKSIVRQVQTHDANGNQICPKPTVQKATRSSLSMTALNFLSCVAPFILYQAYIYSKFCRPNAYYVWCEHGLGFSYSYVQKAYWNVGFLSYWRWNNFLSFVIAMPIFICLVFEYYYFIRYNFFTCLTLGGLIPVGGHSKAGSTKQRHTWSFPGSAFVYMAHLGVLSAFGFVTINVHVMNRLVMSTSPFFYWLCAIMTSTSAASRQWHDLDPWKVLTQSSHVLGDLLHCFALTFNIMGFLFFTNGYPWT